MTALALGIVGLALVLASHDIARRWLAQREDTRALRAEVEAGVAAAREAVEASVGPLAERLSRVEGDVAAIIERERQERLGRMGGRR